MSNKTQQQNETAEGQGEASELSAVLDRITARAENAYINYIDMCRRDECLGWEAKVDHGNFGANELRAHKQASEELGRHRALCEAVAMLRDAV